MSSVNKILIDTDFNKSDEYKQLGRNPTNNKVMEKYQQYQDRRNHAYATVFGIWGIFQMILSLASRNEPGKLGTFLLVDKKWQKNTNRLIGEKLSVLKRQFPIKAGCIKTAIEEIQDGNSNSFPLQECKKLSEKIPLPVFMKTKLKDVPLTTEVYETLQKELQELQDSNIKIIWKNNMRPYFEGCYLAGDLAPLDWQLVPEADADIEKIRMFLAQDATRKKLEKVETLDLSNLGLTIIPTELGLFINLQKLSLAYNNIAEIKNLNFLKELKWLDLSNNRIEEIHNLYPLQQLTYLNLSNNRIKEIINLDPLQQLRYLELSCNQIKEIKNLELSELKWLLLYGNQISKIENLNCLKKLIFLWLSQNRIAKIENLSELQQLQTLGLADNQIPKIENLDTLQDLQILQLNDNPIVKIENLSKLPCLRDLKLSKDLIVNIEDLNNLQELQKFNGVPITRQVAEGERKRKRDLTEN